MEYNKEKPLKVVTLCSGYDSQCLALERLKNVYPEFDYELVAWSEFDPESKTPLERQPAVVAHNALFPQWKDRNLGDMAKIDWTQVDDFDLLFYSTPCQSISQAGLQHGFTEGSGTRSSIIWNVRDAVKIKRPKFLCLENVKAMVSRKFVGMFNLWQLELERLGYRNFAQVLNAKDYGVLQNRERIFLVSIRVDDDNNMPKYYFPKPFPLERRLKDVLDDNVDEKYYLSDKMIECFQHRTEVAIEKGNGFRFSPTNGNGCGKAITTCAGNRTDDNFIEDETESEDRRQASKMSKTIYGLGRSRSNKGKGEWTGIHLNDYTMCIHTLVGAGFPTMQVLVVEVEDEQDEELHQLCIER